MKRLLNWLDQNILIILVGFLIVFIPLYPKIPLAELIQGYIVRLRLEDLLILLTTFVWVVQLYRGKIKLPQNKLVKFIFIYLGVGLLSIASALVITRTVPLEQAHIFKIFFHWFRRIEYFVLFFLTYSAIGNRKDLILLIKVALVTLVGVVLYGIGQKYFYWPAFSTMNREFSKGVRLYLSPNTRLFSTFGGHYDLAGYLTLLLSFTIPAAWLLRPFWYKVFFYTTSIFGYWCLVLTTSRTSFIGYLLAITLIAWLMYYKQGFWWSLRHYLVTLVLSLAIMFSFSTLIERFTQVIPNKELRDNILTFQQVVNQPFVAYPPDGQVVRELPSLWAYLFKKETLKPIELTQVEKTQLEIVASSSDIPPQPIKPTKVTGLPTDVSLESEEIRKTSAEESGRTYEGPSYSPNALKYGLSMGIRLDELWPQAWAGFLKNPLLGSGYATLNVKNEGEFTYAESTDNDYLRMLGETGLLGSVAFMVIIYYVYAYSFALLKHKSSLEYIVALGGIGATTAMLVTATYIDIFESSKVAYTFWIMVAMIVYLYEQHHQKA